METRRMSGRDHVLCVVLSELAAPAGGMCAQTKSSRAGLFVPLDPTTINSLASRHASIARCLE